jgi:hypothetical protein
VVAVVVDDIVLNDAERSSTDIGDNCSATVVGIRYFVNVCVCCRFDMLVPGAKFSFIFIVSNRVHIL